MIATYIKRKLAFIAGFFILNAFTINTFAAETKNVEAEAEQTESQIKTAATREIHKHSAGFGLGQTFLFSQFEKYGDNRITWDILYSYTASYSFDLLINAHFSSHEYKKKKVHLRGYTMGIKARAWEFDAFSPFIVGGLGFYQPTLTDDDETSEAKWTFGFNGGAGVDLRLNEDLIIGIMTQYHYPFDIKQDEFDTVSGTYLKLLMTLMYVF